MNYISSYLSLQLRQCLRFKRTVLFQRLRHLKFGDTSETIAMAPLSVFSAATFYSVSFSKPNPVWFGKVTPKNCVQFSKPIPVWFGKKKIDFARRRFQTKFRLVWKILMTIINVLKIPNQYQFGLEKF